MAISLDCVATVANLAGYFSNGVGRANEIKGKFVPKDSAGAVFDCTGLTGITAKAVPAGLSSVYSTEITFTLGTHDATGVEFTVSAADVQSAITAFFGASNLSYTVTGTDGTNIVILARGSLTLNVLP